MKINKTYVLTLVIAFLAGWVIQKEMDRSTMARNLCTDQGGELIKSNGEYFCLGRDERK